MMMSQAAGFGEAFCFCFVLVKTVVSSSRWMSLWVITRCEGGGIFKKDFKKKDETNTESAASSSSNQSSVMGNAGLGVCAQNVSHLLPLVETLAIYGAFLLFLFFFCFFLVVVVSLNDTWELQCLGLKWAKATCLYNDPLWKEAIRRAVTSLFCFSVSSQMAVALVEALFFSFPPPSSSIFSLLFCFIIFTSRAPWNEAIAFSFSDVLQVDILSFQVRRLNI